jgi:hypothetical protein
MPKTSRSAARIPPVAPGAQPVPTALLKLNLGCGHRKLDGYVNADAVPDCQPDVVFDIEQTPWPWADNSVSDIFLSHVLEHVGGAPQVYLNIIKEMWRVCADGALVHIIVPHHRHDNFYSDPTHVRPVTQLGLSLFDKQQCQQWVAGGFANTPLALYTGVDFVIENCQYDLDNAWIERINAGELTPAQALDCGRDLCNVIAQMQVWWRVHKHR